MVQINKNKLMQNNIMKSGLLGLAQAACLVIIAGSCSKTHKELENPEFIGLHIEKPHCTYYPFDDTLKAIVNDPHSSPYILFPCYMP